MECIAVRALWDTLQNYIWILHYAGQSECIVVDPGEVAPCIEALERHGLSPQAVFITHHHYDHTDGVAGLLQHYGTLPVWGPKKSPFNGISHAVGEGDIVEVPEMALHFEVLETPGHTMDHICLYNRSLSIALVGDTLFSAGCGRVFEGTMMQMFRSINKIAALSDETLLYCGHEYTVGNLAFAKQVEPNNKEILSRYKLALDNHKKMVPSVPTTLALEKKTNPFLRCDQISVHKSCEEYRGRELTSAVEVFTALREWRG